MSLADPREHGKKYIQIVNYRCKERPRYSIDIFTIITDCCNEFKPVLFQLVIKLAAHPEHLPLVQELLQNKDYNLLFCIDHEILLREHTCPIQS